MTVLAAGFAGCWLTYAPALHAQGSVHAQEGPLETVVTPNAPAIVLGAPLRATRPDEPLRLLIPIVEGETDPAARAPLQVRIADMVPFQQPGIGERIFIEVITLPDGRRAIELRSANPIGGLKRITLSAVWGSVNYARRSYSFEAQGAAPALAPAPAPAPAPAQPPPAAPARVAPAVLPPAEQRTVVPSAPPAPSIAPPAITVPASPSPVPAAEQGPAPTPPVEPAAGQASAALDPAPRSVLPTEPSAGVPLPADPPVVQPPVIAAPDPATPPSAGPGVLPPASAAAPAPAPRAVQPTSPIVSPQRDALKVGRSDARGLQGEAKAAAQQLALNEAKAQAEALDQQVLSLRKMLALQEKGIEEKQREIETASRAAATPTPAAPPPSASAPLAVPAPAGPQPEPSQPWIMLAAGLTLALLLWGLIRLRNKPAKPL